MGVRVHLRERVWWTSKVVGLRFDVGCKDAHHLNSDTPCDRAEVCSHPPGSLARGSSPSAKTDPREAPRNKRNQTVATACSPFNHRLLREDLSHP